MYILIIVFVLLFIATIIFLYKKLQDQSKILSDVLDQRINHAFRQANQELINLAKQSLEKDKTLIHQDLKNKKEEIYRLVDEIRKDLENSKSKLLESESQRIKTFASLKQELQEYKQITKELSVTTDSLRKILSNNQMRGQFGEQVAEDLLKMSGFVKGITYDYNKKQDSRSSRPDFIIYLPDKTKIYVDVKFPYQNLQKMAEATASDEKLQYKKLFANDVKTKIKEVSTRDYINPEEKTVDFVILFIPNEMIFSYIYDQLEDVWQEAIKKKVVLAGPFSFIAILRMIKQSYQYFSFQNNLKEIHKNILAFADEFTKFDTEFRKIGTQLDTVLRTYERVSTTRYNQLSKKLDRVLSDKQTLDNTPTLPKHPTKIINE